MQTASYTEKEAGRFKRGQGWKINLFGKNSDVPRPDLQAFRIDMAANMVLPTHLHVVDQFQIFIAGSGTIGRDNAVMVTAHYADHHTAYGPLVAGAQGMSYLTLRPRTDAGIVKLDDPGLRAALKPSRRRHRVSSQITLSIEPVLRHREEVGIESVMEEKPGDDGMAVKIYRLGGGKAVAAPDTAGTGGYYIIVMNGSLVLDGEELTPWSLAFVAADEPAPLLQAGEAGLEAMVAIFPVADSWMQEVAAM